MIDMEVDVDTKSIVVSVKWMLMMLVTMGRSK
jgi:hypothetical protein